MLNKLNNLDTELINSFRKNSRESLTNIANKTKKSINTVFSRSLNLNKYFESFKSILAFEKIGFPIHVLMISKYSPKFLEFTEVLENINTLQVCGVEKKVFAMCYFPSLLDFENFREKIFEVNKFTEFFFVDEVLRENFLVNSPN